MAKIVLLQNGRVGHQDFRAERRVGKEDIDLAEEFAFAEVVVPDGGIFEGVRLIDSARAVIIHDHVHF